MVEKIYRILPLLVIASLFCQSAIAAIMPSEAHIKGTVYEDCSMTCSQFNDSVSCKEFRRSRLICTEKKKSTWPIITAQAD